MRYITDACRALVPEVLMEYLFGLAEESNCPQQSFVLSVRKMGIGEVQNILLRRGCDSFCRRVFGCSPVETELIVTRSGGNIYMSLCGAEKEEKRPFRGEIPVCSA